MEKPPSSGGGSVTAFAAIALAAGWTLHEPEDRGPRWVSFAIAGAAALVALGIWFGPGRGFW